jgi:hypothetical protein
MFARPRRSLAALDHPAGAGVGNAAVRPRGGRNVSAIAMAPIPIAVEPT